MPCKQCQRNRQRALEKRRLIDQQKRQTLAEVCMAGDQKSCRELQQLTASDEYRATQPIPVRASPVFCVNNIHPAIADGVNVLSGD